MKIPKAVLQTPTRALKQEQLEQLARSLLQHYTTAKVRDKASTAALKLLKRNHPEEYKRLYNREINSGPSVEAQVEEALEGLRKDHSLLVDYAREEQKRRTNRNERDRVRRQQRMAKAAKFFTPGR